MPLDPPRGMVPSEPASWLSNPQYWLSKLLTSSLHIPNLIEFEHVNQ